MLEPDPRLRREGRDAHTETTISVSLAVFGGEVRVPTVTGEAALKIPPGTQPEAQFRLRGEGFPTFRGTGRGDEIVLVHVELPKHLSAHQKDLLREALGSDATPAARPRGGLFGRRG
jgi:DnaJ-class molecular chaperone